MCGQCDPSRQDINASDRPIEQLMVHSNALCVRHDETVLWDVWLLVERAHWCLLMGLLTEVSHLISKLKVCTWIPPWLFNFKYIVVKERGKKCLALVTFGSNCMYVCLFVCFYSLYIQNTYKCTLITCTFRKLHIISEILTLLLWMYSDFYLYKSHF